MEELRLLRGRIGDDVPLHAAVVDQGDVLYFSLDWIIIPEVTSDDQNL